MNGLNTFPNKLSRRRFITAASLGALSVTGVANSHQIHQFFQKLKKNSIPIRSHDQARHGHKMREEFSPDGYTYSHSETVSILGAGISGLTCGYFLSQKPVHANSFSIYDIGEMAGGNSAYFSNEVSRASWGAHYLPLPSAENELLIQFLKDHDIIVGENNGRLIYDEEYLCHDPKERLLIRGRWQDSLRPQIGITDLDQQQIQLFLDSMEQLKWQRGSDGKWAFDIPVERSSQDPQFTDLDKMTFQDYLHSKGLHSEALMWMCNYSCLDDFGTPIEKISAWAGLHYFCSRRNASGPGVEANDDVLVWPEGNGYLKDRLESKLKKPVVTETLVRKVEPHKKGFRIFLESLQDDRKYFVDSEHVVYALPRYTAPYILGPGASVQKTPSYYPWLLSHVIVKKSALESHADLTWDTVKFGEKGLGYINNNHQDTNPEANQVLITTYHVFADESPKQEREKLRSLSPSDVREFVIRELEKFHPEIVDEILSINYKILGHAMISPEVDFIWNHRIQSLPRMQDGVIFAHSDMSGISIFEEAFYQGHRAFQHLIDRMGLQQAQG